MRHAKPFHPDPPLCKMKDTLLEEILHQIEYLYLKYKSLTGILRIKRGYIINISNIN